MRHTLLLLLHTLIPRLVPKAIQIFKFTLPPTPHRIAGAPPCNNTNTELPNCSFSHSLSFFLHLNTKLKQILDSTEGMISFAHQPAQGPQIPTGANFPLLPTRNCEWRRATESQKQQYHHYRTQSRRNLIIKVGPP